MFVRPPDDPAGRRGIPHGKRSADKLWTSRPVRSCVVIYRFVRCGQSRLSQSLAVEELHLLISRLCHAGLAGACGGGRKYTSGKCGTIGENAGAKYTLLIVHLIRSIFSSNSAKDSAFYCLVFSAIC